MQSDAAAERAALKEEFDQLRSRVNTLESRHQGVLAGLSQATGLSRRQLLAIAGAAGGAGAIGALGAQPAQGAAQDSADEGDFGSTGSPFEGFADGLAMVTQSVNTSTTINKPVVLADSALGSLTLDIDAALEGPSGFSQMVTVIDQTGNAGTNSIVVNASDGTTIATIDSDDAWFTARWDSGEWSTKRFIPTVEVGSLAAGSAVIGEGDTIQQVEFGEVSVSPGASSSSTTDTQTSGSQSVTFSTEFATAPQIFISIENIGELIVPNYNGVTTTGFNVRLTNFSSTDPGAVDCDWIAIGP